jgi:hypothetical protein
LKVSEAPADASNAVRQTVADLARAGTLGRGYGAKQPPAGVPAGEAVPFRAARAVPVFMVPFSRLTSNNFLPSAVADGWCCAIIGAGDAPAGLAYVGETAAGRISFRKFTGATSAGRFLAAAKAAETRFGAAGETFEVRLLELASIRVTALWLHGTAADHFIPIDYQGSIGSAVDDLFIRRVLRSAAAHRTAGEIFLRE